MGGAIAGQVNNALSKEIYDLRASASFMLAEEFWEVKSMHLKVAKIEKC